MQEKKEGRQIQYTSMQDFKKTENRKKKTDTKKLSDYINNIYQLMRPYERYYSESMDILQT